MDYPAKILLFGEYGIILNSMALAIPYPEFSGHFSFFKTADNQSNIVAKSNSELRKLLSFFKTDTAKFQFINLELLEHDIDKGLYFDSTIPIGSGLGSSGAVTAALYEKYVIPPNYNLEYQTIKTNLAAIETHFHGLSSGFDPLISLLKKPVLMESHTSFTTDIDLSLFFNTYTLFLINTHSSGKTGTLVNTFMEQYHQPVFKEKIDHEYIPLINQIIIAVNKSDFRSFDRLISRYSKFQLSHFEAMIPAKMRTVFKTGIETGDFHLKLCGSGGGGYFLGIARDRKKAESYFNLNHLGWTVV